MSHGMFCIPIRRMTVRNVHSGLITDLPIDSRPVVLQRNLQLVLGARSEIRRIIVDHIDVVQRLLRMLLVQNISDRIAQKTHPLCTSREAGDAQPPGDIPSSMDQREPIRP
jgi:hypothetical protein